MHSIPVLVSFVTLLALVEAHGGIQGAPKLFGRRTSTNAKVRRNVFEDTTEQSINNAVIGPHLDSRANTNGQCGSSFGSCAPGVCCSSAGYCGTGTQYCAAPDCQIAYGPGCDGNAVPPGGSTSNVPRPNLGSQPYGGAGIVDCTVNGLIALTFDDGPYIYTSDILDVLKSYNAKATFFITGNNLGKGAIDDPTTIYPALIKRMYAEGHQIASHTWSHQDLSLITATERLDQMYNNEAALRNILGFFPTYMRPPYSSCDADCESALGTLGYHITYFDLDTDDYDNSTPDLIQNAKNNFDKAINGTHPASNDFLAIAHDIHDQTAHNLTKFMLDDLLAKGYKTATVGECLNDPATNWYRSASPEGSVSSTRSTSSPSSTTDSSTFSGSSKPTATNISPDATCGGSMGYNCLKSTFGDCCSTHGYCGSTDAYCLPANGCQPLFGACGALSSSTPSTPSATPSLVISTDATCGGITKNTCLGSTFGNCCSGAGYCGSSSAYCTAGCQAPFGSCDTTPLPSGGVSVDATCGGTSKFTCLGSTFGNCCSQAGYCGSTVAYCLPANGCQTQFGTCSNTS